jgi:hypothetical protein
MNTVSLASILGINAGARIGNATSAATMAEWESSDTGTVYH